MQKLLDHPTYDPAAFFDAMKQRFGMEKDIQLANFIGLNRVNLSKMRNKLQPISSRVLVRLSEDTGLPVRELRALMGVQA